MTELNVLNTYNDFSSPLPTELVSLKNLIHLCLGGNFFLGPISKSYSKIQSLKFLGLNGNADTGKALANLARLKNLKEMYLGYYNSFEGGISLELGLLSSLQLLNMASCCSDPNN